MALSWVVISARLPVMIWRHRPGSEPAMRVTSRTPCPARRRSSGGASASRAAVSELMICGTWLISATARSWSAGARRTSRAPQMPMSCSTRRTSSGETVPSAITQVRSANRRGLAVSGPENSEPAIGCEPT